MDQKAVEKAQAVEKAMSSVAIYATNGSTREKADIATIAAALNATAIWAAMRSTIDADMRGATDTAMRDMAQDARPTED